MPLGLGAPILHLELSEIKTPFLRRTEEETARGRRSGMASPIAVRVSDLTCALAAPTLAELLVTNRHMRLVPQTLGRNGEGKACEARDLRAHTRYGGVETELCLAVLKEEPYRSGCKRRTDRTASRAQPRFNQAPSVRKEGQPWVS